MPRLLVVLMLAAALAGCATPPMRQSDAHIQASDAASAPANIPAPVQTLPALPKPKPMARPETYSVVVNNVPVHELLFALSRDAKLNIDVHPGITGVVTLNAIDQTLPQLLSRISKQVDMRYELDGQNLLVMPDSPFLRTYKIDYVNMQRNMTGTVVVSGQITGQGAPGTGGAGGGATGVTSTASNNTSTVSVTNTSNNAFWTRLKTNVIDILSQSAAAPGTQAQPGAPPGQPTVTPGVLASVIDNPEAGMLMVRATSRQHERIQEFLDQVLTSARRQVLIEATIVSVELNNTYQQGIDWEFLRTGTAGLSGGIIGSSPSLSAGTTASLLTLNYNSNTFRATLRLLETFGNVRVLSSPRISAVNNQTAVLKVVDNLVYFLVSANTSQAQTTALTTVTTTPQTVPVGLVMNVTPQISDDSTILLNVKPSITRLLGFVDDPNPLLRSECSGIANAINCLANLPKNRIPQTQTREMESLIKLVSGQIAVMGGLIQDELQDNADTVPGLNRIPIVGNVFGNRNIVNRKSELVIFLRPIIIREPGIDGDYQAYRSYLPREDFMNQRAPGRAVVLPGGNQ